MYDQYGIDLVALAQRLGVGEQRGREFKSACPICGNGDDRFWINEKLGDALWHCRKCNNGAGDSGTSIGLVRKALGMKPKEARLFLGLPTDSLGGTSGLWRGDLSRVPAHDPFSGTLDYDKPIMTNERYQTAAATFVDTSEHYLWENPEQKQYLKNRGVWGGLAAYARLGYNRRTHYADWGIGDKVWLPRGIVIPYYADGQLVSIRIRCLDEHIVKKNKYMSINGMMSSVLYHGFAKSGGLWNWHKQMVVLCEGEFDALTVLGLWEREKLELDLSTHTTTAISIGAASWCRRCEWRDLLSEARAVVIAFDNDKAGNNAASVWLKALPNAVRLKPTNAKDINEMWQRGDNRALIEWLTRARVLAMNPSKTRIKQGIAA